MRDYTADLEKLGLSDKEAKVYLAALTLGPETAQNISKRAGVNRATTYVAIKSLTSQGLMSAYEKGRKQYFIASGPDSLLALYDKEVTRLSEKKALAERLAPMLRGIQQHPGKKAVVRYFEGKDGLDAMIKESLKEVSQETLRIIVPYDLARQLLTSEEESKLHEFKVKREISTRVLYTKTDGDWPSTTHNKRKKIGADKYPLSSDIAIYPNKVRIATLGDHVSGIVIQDKQFAQTLRSIFELAWEGVEK